MYNSIEEQSRLPPDTLYNAILKELKTKSKHLIWDIIDSNGFIFTIKEDILNVV